MPKNEIDWTPLVEALETTTEGVSVVPPEIANKELIDQEVRRIELRIADCISRRSTIANRLVSYATNSDPEDYFVRASALVALLTNHDLIDTFYEESTAGLLDVRDMSSGQSRRFRDPLHSGGEFQVTNVETVLEGASVSRTTVSYLVH